MINRTIFKLFILIGLATIQSVHSQENAQTRIPLSLEECYQDPDIFERDNRLPMTMNILIELIRKLEDTRGYEQDIRQLSVSLLHRFKLDGIERASGVQYTRKVIPFSPIGYQFSKHRIQLSRLIPGNAINFANDTLTAKERCTLHFMLSNSIETQVRGDEAFRCNQLAQLRVNRVPRSVDEFIRNTRSVPKKNNFLGDVELLEELEEHNRRKKIGHYQLEEEVSDDEEDERVEEPPVVEEIPGPSPRHADAGLVEVSTNLLSQCPVQNGVIRTPWGSLTAGSVIAGIAAGLEPQTVTTRDLIALSRSKNDQFRSRQTQSLSVDNRWAATLSGDLAEVALLQAPGVAQVSVGASGGWNNTIIPKWYFLTQRERLEMTDAEIRGGLDGLILAKNVANYRSRGSSLKLSQLLDMYYSPRGVYSSNFRACERRTHFTTVAGIEEMTTQATAFGLVLDKEMQLKVTLRSEAIAQFAGDAAQALSTYVPSSLDDLSCETTAIVPNDATIWRTATDIYIYVDTTWQFAEIQPVLAYLLDNLDVNRYGSSYTILNARTGNIIINTTNSLVDFHAQLNFTIYQNEQQGLDLTRIFDSIRTMGKEKLDYEKQVGSSGGRSNIALIIPQTAGVNEAESNAAFERVRIIEEEVPDLALIFLTGGSQLRFERFVRQPHRDLFSLRTSTTGTENVAASVNDVIQRIQQVPRRIINPKCGSAWWSDELATNRMNQYVESGSVNFYRIHPNYFFRTRENRKVRIEGQRFGVLTVCTSRIIENPRANMTGQENVECVKIDSEHFEINLQNACDGSWLIHKCPPVYISVEGPPTSQEAQIRCTDVDCRFNDQSRFLVLTENLGCFSGVGRLLSATNIILASVFLAVINFLKY